MIDLHLHTTASDGRSTPRELVAHAVAGRLSVMAATDHDTTAACAEVHTIAAEHGIEAITGIEITAIENARDVHVLGYFLDADDPALAAFLERQRLDRIGRIQAMSERLEQLGVPVDVTAVIAGGRSERGRSLGRPLIARAMVEAGHCVDTREAFDKWLGEGCPAFVPRTGAPVKTVIGIIHAAGGIVSLAHPGKTRVDDRLREFADAGLDALEAFHPDHDEPAVVHYLRMADELGVIVTGGSDFHGDPAHGLAPGSVTLPHRHWEKLRARARERNRLGRRSHAGGERGSA